MFKKLEEYDRIRGEIDSIKQDVFKLELTDYRNVYRIKREE
jgi:hypothetical protein